MLKPAVSFSVHTLVDMTFPKLRDYYLVIDCPHTTKLFLFIAVYGSGSGFFSDHLPLELLPTTDKPAIQGTQFKIPAKLDVL